ncbi:hypothetical protein AYO47_05955 [Planctomyces sp. SCGC AG-212-M04]|nr:hypothetical protein AYO47_05955 [Planctomyces sp. SCGC AG-212-M04]
MPSTPRRLLLATLFVLAIPTAIAWPAPVVSENDALSPEEQRKKFKLPPGFEIQLVAAEPDIGKPMNLSFDARGRLWVTHSLEYPFPTAGEGVQPRDLNQDQITEHAPRDHYSYFESIGPDGRGGKLVHFAEGLNIPIGQLPLVSSHEETAALNYSIPSIKLYQNGPGDGLAASSKVLFTGFGNVDTHGMCNSLTRAFDGWVYACHGFRNTSNISRPGGETLLSLNSGNTIRFKPDGSALEQFTKGQVNPFGMSFDTWGNLYNADCHSMPVTCLLRGATYTSFGKPDDGLGFGPNMINHNHGSTGICGVAWYDAPQFPEEYRDCLYICNPVNGQVHRDKLDWNGSSPSVSTRPEFIRCSDEWFRPVDVKLGPDGALYIADFYNAIIGHYEAPLQHPRRDRTHARIWRVIYAGNEGGQKPSELADLTIRGDEELVVSLGDPNFTVRNLATNLLVDRYAPPVPSVTNTQSPVDRTSALKLLRKALASSKTPANQFVHAAWAWSRLLHDQDGGGAEIIAALVKHQEPIVRNHAARILGATSNRSLARVRPQLLASLSKDTDARVRRAAVEALALHPAETNLETLLQAYDSAVPLDSHLRYATRIALRARLMVDKSKAAQLSELPTHSQHVLAGVTPAVNPCSPELTQWLRGLIASAVSPETALDDADWKVWIRPASRYSEGGDFDALLGVLVKAAGDDVGEQVANLRAALSGRQAGGLSNPDSLIRWAERLSMTLLSQASNSAKWTYQPLPGSRRSKSPFAMRMSPLGKTGGRMALISSLPGGESEEGIYRSPSFEIPPQFSFWLAGHNGPPDTPDAGSNLIRLVDASSGEVLRQVFPPRNDTAELIEWDLKDVARRSGAIEIVDAHSGASYAWVAAGKFSVSQLNLPPQDGGALAVALIKDLRLTNLEPRLEALVLSEDRSLRTHAASALIALKPDARISALLLWADDPDVPKPLEAKLWQAIHHRDASEARTMLSELLVGATTDRQRKAADALVTDRAGGELLLALAEEGRLSPVLLQPQAMKFKLAQLKEPALMEKATQLTASLPAPDLQLALLIAGRKKSFDPDKCSTDNGKTAFLKRCAICHQIGTEGAKVGPQLDGVGIRGIDRLLEDILDPNRNVDAAFRSSAIALNDGRILIGLKRREEGADIVFANNEGKEFRVPSADIEEMKLSPTSLMPGNLGESIPAEEMADILAWLLTQKPPGK